MPFDLTKRLSSSISFRIAFLFCITFSVALVAAFAVSYFQMTYTLENSNREVLSSKFREAATILTSSNIRGLKEFLSDEKNRILNAPYMVRVLSIEGEAIYLKPSVQEKKFDFELAFKKVDKPETLVGWSSLAAIDDEDMFNILTDKVGEHFYLQIGKSNEDHEDILGRMLEVFLATGGFFILLSAGLGFWYARKSLAPLRDLLVTIKTIERGDLSQRVTLNGIKDELHDLGDTFNRMIARIEKLVQVMKESLDNVAHDIRTPLTKIRAIAEDSLTSSNPIPLKEALQDCAENAAEVSELVDQLMSISEAEAGTLNLKYANCNIETLLRDVTDIYEFVAQEKNISVSVKCDAALDWSLDRKRIKQAIGNLVDNAIKFSPEGSEIQISASVHENSLSVVVNDHGIGISEADLSRIWDRLFRADKARTTKGLGLGLSIVQSVITAHQGKTEAIQNPKGGMTFSFTIPQFEHS